MLTLCCLCSCLCSFILNCCVDVFRLCFVLYLLLIWYCLAVHAYLIRFKKCCCVLLLCVCSFCFGLLFPCCLLRAWCVFEWLVLWFWCGVLCVCCDLSWVGLVVICCWDCCTVVLFYNCFAVQLHYIMLFVFKLQLFWLCFERVCHLHCCCCVWFGGVLVGCWCILSVAV